MENRNQSAASSTALDELIAHSAAAASGAVAAAQPTVFDLVKNTGVIDPVTGKRGWSAHAAAPRPDPDARFGADGVTPVGLTFEQLLDSFNVKHSPSAGVQRNLKTGLSRFCESSVVGKSLGAVMGDEFSEKHFEAYLGRVVDEWVSQGTHRKTAQNTASDVRRLFKHYQAYQHDMSLPESFGEALATILIRKGMKAHDLRALHSETAYHWAVGETTPKRSASLGKVAALEKALGVPEGVLTSRVRRHIEPEYDPTSLPDNLTDPAYNRYQGVINSYPYRLSFKDWPEHLKSLWAHYERHKKKHEHLVDGFPVRLDATKVWSSAATVNKYRELWSTYLGWLCLPAPPDNDWDRWSAMEWTERLKYGAGMKPEDITFEVFLDWPTLYRYYKYQQNRSYNEQAFAHEEARWAAREAGQPVPPSHAVDTMKASQTVEQFHIMCNNMVNSQTSFVLLNHKLLAPLMKEPVAVKDWSDWCEEKHQSLIGKASQFVNEIAERGKRNPKDKLKVFLKTNSPADPLFKLEVLHEQNMAPVTAPRRRLTDQQYLLVIKLMNATLLRGHNVIVTLLTSDFTFYADLSARLFIPAERFKNEKYGYAQDFEMLLPSDLGASVAEWIYILRPLIEGHDKCENCFLTATNKGGVERYGYGLRMDTFRNWLKPRSKLLLGFTISPHNIRTLGANGLAAKGASRNQLAAALNDSPAVAEQHYEDRQNLAQQIALQQMRAAVREDFNNRSGPSSGPGARVMGKSDVERLMKSIRDGNLQAQATAEPSPPEPTKAPKSPGVLGASALAHKRVMDKANRRGTR